MAANKALDADSSAEVAVVLEALDALEMSMGIPFIMANPDDALIVL